jgi:autotransporter-associated beta strand protein
MLGLNCFCVAALAVNYEVYPGSAFYLTQMVDSVSYPYVAQFASGFYYHPVGFGSSSDVTLTMQQKQAICDNFSNSFAMVEGDMGNTDPNADVGDINTIAGFGLTPIAAFVNRPASNLAVWRQLVANNGALNTPSYEMLAPHVVDNYPGGFNDPQFDYARANMLVPGCAGSGVDAPVYLYRNNGSFYQQVIWDQRDWTVAHGKKFNYLISPNSSTGQQLMLDTKYLVQSLEDNGHEADVYGCVLYGLRPVDLTPETTNYNGVVQANWTITGLAYYLLKHRDGEPGTLDLYATSNGVNYAQSVMSPVATNAAQLVPFTATKTNQFTLTLTNRSAWLDYAGVLRARADTNLLANWNVTFQIGTTNITSAVLSQTGYVFLAGQRWQPNTARQVTVTLGPKGAPTPLDLVIEGLPHAGIDQALDVIAFQYQTNQTPPTLAFNAIDRSTRQGLATAPIWFTVGDAETISTQLVVTAVSGNTTLVPNTNLIFGQSGIQRWLNITPASGQWGSAPITVSVTDGQFTNSKTFNLSVERTNILSVVKSNNVVNLEATNSWVGNTTPGFYDQATWNSTVTSANTTTLGSDLDWAGIKIQNPGGLVTINGTNTLGLDVAGVDMSAATQDLVVNCPLETTAFGSWNIAASRSITVNNRISGYGGMTVDGGGKLSLNSSNSFLGPLTLNAGTLLLAYPNAQSGTTLNNNSVLRVAHSGAFGAGGLTMSPANSSTGRLELSNNISVLAGKTLSLNARSSSTDAIRNVAGTNTLGATISFGSGGGNYWIQSDAGQLTLAGTITSAASGTRTLTLQGAANGVVSGVIQDGSATMPVTKTGSGTWTLTATNTYTGTTTVNGGTLLINGRLNGVGGMSVNSGGTLGGSGVLQGAVAVASGAMLSPGTSIGILTISNSLTLNTGSTNFFELNKAASTNDSVRGLTSVTYGGMLSLTNVSGALTNTSAFKLFYATSYGGGFAALTPALPAAGLRWNTNTLAVDGTLRITNAPVPRITSATLFGTNIIMVATNGTPGFAVYLQASTNLALPTAWSRVATNNFDASGGVSWTNFVNATTKSSFFRMEAP